MIGNNLMEACLTTAEREHTSPLQPNIPTELKLPKHRSAYYGGQWRDPIDGDYVEAINPGTGQSLGKLANCGAIDIDAAVATAKAAFDEWRHVAPLERAKLLKRLAQILRDHAGELAMIDAADCGNPVKEMLGDAHIAAAQLDYFAGLVTEVKGASIPMGPDAVNFSVREPRGVVGRIFPFNHPFMFCAGKSAAALATGNTIVVKPPEQAWLASLRLVELAEGISRSAFSTLYREDKRPGLASPATPILQWSRWLAASQPVVP